MSASDAIAISPHFKAASEHAGASPGLLLPALSLCRRELVRFLRQRHRVIGAFLTPIVFWLLIGGGMGHSFQARPGAGGAGAESAMPKGYMQYFFPGTILMILLFTAIFSTISIIEDRREGFLQSVLVAPVGRMAIVLGKVLGGTVLAFGQGLIFLLLAPTVGIHLTLASFALSALVMLIISFGLTALGFCIAWRMSSTQGFHAIMNLFLMPMWFLSGALFPADNAAGPIRWVMRANPLSYGYHALCQALYLNQLGGYVAFTINLAITVVCCAALFALASMIAGGRVAADLQ
jgi:ABC-2 type transport system permease protein